MTRLLAVLAWIVAWGSAPTLAEEGVPFARDLQQDAATARAKGAAVMVVFVGSHCPYCEAALNEVIYPTSRNPAYQKKLVMRRIETSSELSLRDFSGKRSTHRKFAGEHGIYLVPTVMLFDDKGEVIAKPLVGITTVDYFSYDLDQAIDQAMARIRPGG